MREVEGNLRREPVGGNYIYEAVPDGVNVAYPIVGTGNIQYVNFDIGQSFRLNKIEVLHTDDTGAITGTRWICDVELWDRRGGAWRTVFQHSVTASSILHEFGEEYNWVGRRIRLTLNGPQGYLFYPMFTLQFLRIGKEMRG